MYVSRRVGKRAYVGTNHGGAVLATGGLLRILFSPITVPAKLATKSKTRIDPAVFWPAFLVSFLVLLLPVGLPTFILTAIFSHGGSELFWDPFGLVAGLSFAAGLFLSLPRRSKES